MRDHQRAQESSSVSPASGANAMPLGPGEGFLAMDEIEAFTVKSYKLLA